MRTSNVSMPKLLVSILTLEAIITPAAIAQPSQDCFIPRFDNPAYCVPRRPLSVAVGDLDGDGNLDLATALQFGPIPDTVAVLFGRGDGTLGDMVSYDGGFEPFSVAFGDLDADGDLDLIALDAGGVDFNGALPGAVSVLLNNGDGTLFVHMILDLGLRPQSLALHDLDGDGDLDVAVAITGGDMVTILRNDGDATFVVDADYPSDAPQAIAVGDLNGDGANDFVTADWLQDVVSVRLNNGDGTFGKPVSYDSGLRPTSVAIGDLDGDGDADLAIGNFGDSFFHGATVSIVRNNGDGVFVAPVPFEVGESPTSVHMADLDGDDDIDLAVTNEFSDDVSVLLNNGDATFAEQVTTSAGLAPYSVASGDFDGDGDLDLTVANMAGNTLTVLPNQGDGSFQDVQNHDVGAGAEPTAVAMGDLDNDGDLDLAITNRGSDGFDGTVSLLFNFGDGSFAEQGLLGTGFDPESIAIGDLDGDGDADLAVTNYGNGNVSVWLNNGNGAFDDDIRYGTGVGPQSLAMGDLDGDRDLDLAVANAASGNVSILLNDGDGTFADDAIYLINGGDFSLPISIALGDVDLDGDLDLATANIKPFNVSLLLNDGDGAFGNEVLFPFTLPQAVDFADMDGDGDVDLVVANGFISVSFNNGDGLFSDPVFFDPCYAAYFVTTGDMNGDGDLDIVTREASNAVGVLLNDGKRVSPAFGDIELFRVGSEPLKVAIGDLNGDGALDLAAVNVASDNVSILLNRSNDCNATPGDLDGDGVVGAGDLIILLGDWGSCADCNDCPADLSSDCTVGVTDLIILLGNWGKAP